MRPFRFLCLLALMSAIPCKVCAQLCPLPQDQEFKPFQNEVQNGVTKFEWYSAAAHNPIKDGGHPSHAFERRVTNTGKGALKYEWKVARMRNQALPEGSEPDRFCQEYGFPNPTDGPLTYGRGDDSTETTVWRGKGEPPPSSLTANLEFTVRENESSYRVVLMVQSGVKATSTQAFQYTYLVKNSSKVPTTLRWAITDVPEVARALKEKGFQLPLELKNDQAIEISFSSKNSPRAEPQALDILTVEHKASNAAVAAQLSLAGADVLALLPKQESPNQEKPKQESPK